MRRWEVTQLTDLYKCGELKASQNTKQDEPGDRWATTARNEIHSVGHGQESETLGRGGGGGGLRLVNSCSIQIKL